MQELRSVSAFTWAGVAVILWGCAPLFEKAGLTRVPPLPALAVRSWLIAGVLLLFVAATRRWDEVRAVDLRSLALLGVGGLMAGLLGQVAYYAALRAGEASRIVPFTAAFPLVTVVLAVVIFREGVVLTKVLGALLVVGGLALLRWGR